MSFDRWIHKEDVEHIYNGILLSHKNKWKQDSPGGPVVKSLPANAGNVGLTPDQGAKIPDAMVQLSPCAATKAAHTPRACAQEHEKLLQWEACARIEE